MPDVGFYDTCDNKNAVTNRMEARGMTAFETGSEPVTETYCEDGDEG